jgi:hypothetical protein
VALDDAKVVAERRLHERFRRGEEPGFFESLFAPSGGATGWYRETEHVLAIGDDLFVAGEAAVQTTALNQIVAVSEAHPELEADAAFLELQHALADAEARIAASRTFFNDTVTLLHDRTRTFPGLLFARWLRLPYHELISAEGFERTVPAVHHTFG